MHTYLSISFSAFLFSGMHSSGANIQPSISTMPVKLGAVSSGSNSLSMASMSLVISAFISALVSCGVCLSTYGLGVHAERPIRMTVSTMMVIHSNFLFILVIYTNYRNRYVALYSIGICWRPWQPCRCSRRS